MTNRTPRLTGKQVIKALRRAGWVRVATSGDHAQFEHPDTSGKVTVADSNKTLKPKTLSSICAQSGLTADELKALL